MNVTQSATTIDTAAPATFTCSQCPFARQIEDNRYCCQVSQTASDVKRGHWEATISCYEALAAAEAEKVTAETEAPIAPAPTETAPAPIATPATPTTFPAPTPAAPAPITAGIDEEPPIRGDGRGRVQPAKSHDRTTAQLAIIRDELAAIGIKLGKLIKSREDIKGWRLDWDGDKAGLYWTIGNGWEIASLKYEAELTGNWEGFDLMEHLDCNGIKLPE
ncbi:hypothetical protein [Microcoleus sp. MON2_D5]|uniref:hypothetical protein n=1 Tax=Microcoleus sp. MON2_D5 TaxID=2818833 RepID=UPI002FD796C4